MSDDSAADDASVSPSESVESARESDAFGVAFYRTMFDRVPDPVVVANAATGAIVEANKSAATLLGRDRAALFGTAVSQLVPAEKREQYAELFERFARESAESAAAVSLEGGFHLEDADGERIPVDVTATSFDLRGDGYVVGVFRDLRERERRDRTLERLHEATRDLLGADSEAEVYAIASRTAADILGLPLHMFLRYDDAADQLEPAALSERSRELFPDYGAFDRGEGAFWRVFESGNPIVTGDIRDDPDVFNPDTPVRSECIIPMGEFGVFVASSTERDDFDVLDVSLAKVLAANTEEALQRTERERQLRERARQLRTVVENVPMVLFAFDDAGVFTLSEGRALAQLGLEPGEAVGQSVFDVYGDHEEIVSNCRSALAGETVRSTVSVANSVFECWYRPIVEDGEVQQVIGTAVDVTQRDRRERLLRVLNRFLRHNLRNAITIILGNAETTLDHDDPAVRDAAEEVIDAGMRLDRLTTKARRLIHLIDIEENPATVPLDDALQWMVDDIERTHDATVDVSPPDGSVAIEEFVVSVGVHELLENAVEHGTEPIELVASVADDETARLVITDEGPGLPEHDKRVLTESDETPLNHGSGLGLFVANWVLSHASGDVEIAETGPEGTTITITVPVSDDSADIDDFDDPMA